MSGDDRKKKDGGRKDKKNQRMHESENELAQGASVPSKARQQSNFTDKQPGPGEKPDRD